MNRRGFFQAAALSTAAVLQGQGRTPSARGPLPGPGRSPSETECAAPIEADLAEPEAIKWVERSATSLFVRLEELDPGDPGQLSGAALHIIDSAQWTYVDAEIGNTAQPYGGETTHCVGYLKGEDLHRLALADPSDFRDRFSVALRELYCGSVGFSGATLILFAGEAPELRLCFGTHCLGVLRGDLLGRFFDSLRRRCALEQREAF